MSGYSPVADLSVASLCFVICILTFFSFIRHSKSYRIFMGIVGVLFLVSDTNVTYHMMLEKNIPIGAAVLRCVTHAMLFVIFLLYVVYICDVTHLRGRQKHGFIGAAIAILCIVVISEILQTVRRFAQGISIINNGAAVYSGMDIFLFGYLAFSTLCMIQMFAVRKRLYRRVMYGFYGTILVSFGMLALQMQFRQSSFTVISFLYPVLGMLYFMHSNPYDVESGALDRRTLEDRIRTNYEKKLDFVFMSLYLKAFAEENKPFPEELRTKLRQFSEGYFKKAVLIRVARGHFIMLFRKDKNPDYPVQIQNSLSQFGKLYSKYRFDYKIDICWVESLN